MRPALLSAALLLVAACAEPETTAIADAASRVPGEVDRLAREQYSGVTSSARVVVTTPEEWAAVWESIYSPYSPKPALPAVDFTQSVVVLAALGEHSSGGYGIDVDDVSQSDAGIVIEVSATAPGSSCGLTAALTQPVVAVRVPRVDGAINFVERSSVRDCK